MPGPENKWKEQSSQPIWDSKTIGDKYGILGETHRDFEQSWLAETQKIDKSKGNSSAAPFNANTFAFRSTKYAYDYDRSKYRKLSGLYGVLSSIQSANTVVTADMISPATYQTCKKSYGISKKELKRLVSDAQQGRVPDFAVKSHHQDATDMQQVSNAVSFEVMKDASTGSPVTGNIHVLRQLETEAILTDATLTEDEKAQALSFNDTMNDRVFMSILEKKYGKNQYPDGWEARLKAATNAQKAKSAPRHLVAVTMHKNLAKLASIDTTTDTKSLTQKILMGKDEKKKTGVQRLKRTLADKRRNSDQKLHSYQAVTLSAEESLDFQKEYGFSKKDLEKLSLEVQSSKTSVFLKA